MILFCCSFLYWNWGAPICYSASLRCVKKNIFFEFFFFILYFLFYRFSDDISKFVAFQMTKVVFCQLNEPKPNKKKQWHFHLFAFSCFFYFILFKNCLSLKIVVFVHWNLSTSCIRGQKGHDLLSLTTGCRVKAVFQF